MADLQSRQPTRRRVLGLIGGSFIALAHLRTGTPAAANQRAEAKGANEFIDFCFQSGGDPFVFTYDSGQVIVICRDLNGHRYTCSFEGTSHYCYLDQVTQPGPAGPLDPGQIEALPTPELDAVITAFPPANDESTPPKTKKRKKKGRRGRSHRRK